MMRKSISGYATGVEVLVTRGDQGFQWELRQTRFVKCIQRCETFYRTPNEARLAGQAALQSISRRNEAMSRETSRQQVGD